MKIQPQLNKNGISIKCNLIYKSNLNIKMEPQSKNGTSIKKWNLNQKMEPQSKNGTSI